MTERQFRFSVTLPAMQTAAEVRAFARKAEDQGFDVLTTADHLLDFLPPFPPLAVAAEATSSLHIGTLVLNNDLRHPALVAREAAALQSLSGGRFELGLGAGHAAPEYAAIGLPFDSAQVRVARLAESIAIIRALFDGGPHSFAGVHYRLRDHALYPQTAAPPLLVGGNARSLLRLAAREAAIVGFTGLGRTLADGQRHDPAGFGPLAVDDRVALVREAAGPRFEHLELNALVQAVVPAERRAAAETMAGLLPTLPIDDILESPFLLLGPVDAMVDALQQRRERWGFTYFSTFAQNMDALAPVIAHLK